MTSILASAPGKAVIAGEYAVLFGAPALVTAIDRRATVRITESTDQYHHVRMPGLANGRWRFRAAPGGHIDWHDAAAEGRFKLFECAWRHCARDLANPVSIEVDTQAFFAAQTAEKYGLGSSAAVTVAIAAALQSANRDGREVWPVARRIHCEFQGGRGSGVDIAASVFGGMLAYRKGDERPPHSLAWPHDLHIGILWSGTAADTREKLQSLYGQGDRQPDALMASAETVASAWGHGVAGPIIEAMRHYTTALLRFSDALDLGIFDAGHREMLALAQSRDVVYKPCGAGGGDVGVVMAETADAVEEFCTSAADFGFATPGLERDPRGLALLEEDRS